MGKFDGPEFDRRVEEALASGKPLPDFPEKDDLSVMAMAWADICTKLQNAGEFTRSESLYITACIMLNTPGPPPG